MGIYKLKRIYYLIKLEKRPQVESDRQKRVRTNRNIYSTLGIELKRQLNLSHRIFVILNNMIV